MQYNNSLVKNFKLIEEEFITTRFYLEWIPNNLHAVSTAFESLLIKIGDEFSSYITRFVLMYSKKERVYINDFIDCINKNCECLLIRGVKIVNTDLVVFPFMNYDDRKRVSHPEWWDKYNVIKHNRYSNVENLVSLKDIIFALTSLSLLNKCIVYGRCPNMLNLILSEKKQCNCCIESELFSVFDSKDYYRKESYFLINEERYLTRDEINIILGENNKI